ncbi:hypothetical protein [Haloarcula salina]|uniref:Uncharacterized protein n=1 Tax=Haloarcula salina TaxID=1429914 RepID=A0AA41G0U1_9EURY|nr:hypothetical protein [Haloarcula salina]MBV0902130.1 hypothetical protein [Haloarcula salina]
MNGENRETRRRNTVGDEVTEELLTVEREPAAGGGERAILYPSNESGTEVRSKWLAVPADELVSLEDVQ